MIKKPHCLRDHLDSHCRSCRLYQRDVLQALERGYLVISHSRHTVRSLMRGELHPDWQCVALVAFSLRNRHVMVSEPTFD